MQSGSLSARFARAIAACVVALAVMSADCAHAQKSLPAGSELQLFVENDMLARTDRYYTNGIKLGGGAHFDPLNLPAHAVLEWLAAKGGTYQGGLFLGQNLYTPRSITVSQAQPYDRPWAAWLYLGGVAQRATPTRLDTVELDLGVVGPAALGRQVQSGWHRLIGSPQPQGWANQLPNEPAFLLSYLAKRRHRLGAMSGLEADAIPHGGISVGTVMALARAGGMLRLGSGLSGFGPDTIEPGGAMLQNVRRDVEGVSGGGTEWYVFAGFDQRLVARNIFLDGTVFRDSPSVQRRPHVYDLSVGFSLRVSALHLSLTRVRRSEEFYTGVGGGGRQTFDSVNLGIEF